MSIPVPPGDLLPAPPTSPARLARSGWIPLAILAAVALFNGVGLLLICRRLVGAIEVDLPLWQVFVTALAATTLAKFSRVAWREHFGRPDPCYTSPLDQVVGWGTSAWLVLLALGCSYPGYRNGEWLTWLPMLIADQFWRQSFFDQGQPGGEHDLAEEPVELVVEPAKLAVDADLPVSDTAGGLTWPAEEYVQQVFRVRDAEGQEVVYAAVRADFLAGQRHATVHVGFCPPLCATPAVEAAACWPDAQVRVTQALPHGVRLDIRLGEPAEEACGVPIDLAATPALPTAGTATAC